MTGRNILQDNSSCPNKGTLTDVDSAQESGTCAQDHTIAGGWAGGLGKSSLSEGDALKQSAILANDRGAADHDAGAVGEIAPASDLCLRQDIDRAESDRKPAKKRWN
jgi:hypothetical protein